MKIIHEIIDLGKGIYGDGYTQIDVPNLLKIYDSREYTTSGGGSIDDIIQGHIILSQNGSTLTQQPKLIFNRMIVSNDNVNNQTVITRPPSVILSQTPPINPLIGDEWVNSITWKNYVFYDSYWVEQGMSTNNSISTIYPPIRSSYSNESGMIADQSNQNKNYIYYDGNSYWEYLGTTNLNINDYRKIGGISFTGTTNFLAKFTALGTIADSQIFDNGTNVGIGTTTFTDSAKLVISGRVSQIDLGSSTFFGFEAGKSDDLSGNVNTAFGYNALKNTVGNSFGYQNTAIGAFAMVNNINGYDNVAIGTNSMGSNTSGYMNMALGTASLFANTTGFWNTAVGQATLQNNTTGSRNTGIGLQAGISNTTGSFNTYIGGLSALNTNGSDNSVVGYNTAQGRSVLNSCILLGAYSTTSGNSQTNSIVIGTSAIGEGSNTTAIGNTSTTLTRLYGQLRVNIINNGVGNFITTSATGVLQQRTAAEVLSDIGGGSGNYVTIDTTQTITGAKTFSLDTVINGVSVGRGGGSSSLNTRVGSSALLSNTDGVGHTAIGLSALSANTTGNFHTAVGLSALSANITGNNNTAVGRAALSTNTSGSNNAAFGNLSLIDNTTGGNNTALGYSALSANTTGNNNTAIGFNAGSLTSAGLNNTISNLSVYIGQDTRAGASGNSNEIVIGVGAYGNGSNTVTLGSTLIVKTILRGTINAANLPTSSVGLITGDIWNDGGTLKIV